MNRRTVTPTFRSARLAGWETGVTKAKPVHGPAARPLLEVETTPEPWVFGERPCARAPLATAGLENLDARRVRSAKPDYFVASFSSGRKFFIAQISWIVRPRSKAMRLPSG